MTAFKQILEAAKSSDDAIRHEAWERLLPIIKSYARRFGDVADDTHRVVMNSFIEIHRLVTTTLIAFKDDDHAKEFIWHIVEGEVFNSRRRHLRTRGIPLPSDVEDVERDVVDPDAEAALAMVAKKLENAAEHYFKGIGSGLNRHPKRARPKGQPLTLLLNASEFTAAEIARALACLSSIYESVGGDGLEIKDITALDFSAVPAASEPVA